MPPQLQHNYIQGSQYGYRPLTEVETGQLTQAVKVKTEQLKTQYLAIQMWFIYIFILISSLLNVIIIIQNKYLFLC